MLPLSLSVPLSIISFIGFLMNIYIFLVVVLTKQVSANNILLLHLAIVNSLLCLLFLAFSLPSIGNTDWILTFELLCNFHGFLITMLHPMALWTIFGLNCDRYYAIAAPLHYSAIINTRKVLSGLASVWLITIILSIPPFFSIAPFQYNSEFGACIPNFLTPNSLIYASIFTVLTFLLPSLLIIGCNIRVLMIARYHRHRIASAIYEVTLSAQVTITHQRNPFFIPIAHGPPKFRGRSPISSVLQIVGSFLILYCPYYITIIWNSSVASLYSGNIPKSLFKHQEYYYFLLCTSALLICSPFFNGILYGIKSKVMRKTFQNYWRKKKTKNEMNHEIQARTPSTCGSRRPSINTMGGLFGGQQQQQRPLTSSVTSEYIIPQRRLSETLININRNSLHVNFNGNNSNNSSNSISNTNCKNEQIKSQLKHSISEITTWNKHNLTFPDAHQMHFYHGHNSNNNRNNMDHREQHQSEHCNVDEPFKSLVIPHTSSCNTLQIPYIDNEIGTAQEQEMYDTMKNSFRSALKSSNPRTAAATIMMPTSTTKTLSSNAKKPSVTSNLIHKVLRMDIYNESSNDNITSNNNNNNSNISSNSSNNSKKIQFNDNVRCSGDINIEDVKLNDRLIRNPPKSPRILITRAQSDDSDKSPSLPRTPPTSSCKKITKKYNRKYSSSSSILSLSDHKWKSLLFMKDKSGKNVENRGNIDVIVGDIYNDGTTGGGCEGLIACSIDAGISSFDDSESDSPCLPPDTGTTFIGSTNSTTISDISTTNNNNNTHNLIASRKFASLDEESNYFYYPDITDNGKFNKSSATYRSTDLNDDETEEQLLLSWPTTRKKYKTQRNNIHQYHQYNCQFKLFSDNNNRCKNNLFVSGNSSEDNIVDEIDVNSITDDDDNIHHPNYQKETIEKLLKPNPLFTDRCEEPEIIL